MGFSGAEGFHTGNPGGSNIIVATIITSNAATTTLQIISVPLNSVILIESYISSKKTAGAGIGTIGDGNGYVRTVKAKNVAGVVTIGLVQTSFTSEDIVPFNATFDVSGTDVRLRVTGAVNDTVQWRSVTNVYIN